MSGLNPQPKLVLTSSALITASLLLGSNASAEQTESAVARLATTDWTLRQAWAQPGDMFAGVSPSGRYFALSDWSFGEGGDVAVYDRVTGKVRLLTDNATFEKPIQYSEGNKVWSPDGQLVAYNWFSKGRFELRSVGIDGSEPKVIYRDKLWEFVAPLAWSSDGQQILIELETAGRIRHALISVADGSARILKLRSKSPNVVSLSPDGRYVVYDAPQSNGQRQHDIYITATDGSFEAGLVEHPGHDYDPLWMADGKRIVFISDRNGRVNLWVLRVDVGQPVGEPQSVPINMSGMVPMGTSRSGSYFFRDTIPTSVDSDIYVANVNVDDGKVLNASRKLVRRWEGHNTRPSWSPDGKFLAYISYRSPNTVMVIQSTESSLERVIPLPNWQQAARPRWSPDGRSLLYIGSNDSGLSTKYVIDVETGVVSPFSPHTDVTHRQNDADWSLDGKRVFYIQRVAKDQNKLNLSIIAENRGSDDEKLLFQNADHVKGSDAPRRFAVSPSGRQLAFTSQKNVSIISVDGGTPRVVFQSDPKHADDNLDNSDVAWSLDERWLIFSRRGLLFQVPVDGGTPRMLNLGTEGLAINYFSLHPDGRQVVFSAERERDEFASHLGGIFVLENFLSPLTQEQ